MRKSPSPHPMSHDGLDFGTLPVCQWSDSDSEAPGRGAGGPGPWAGPRGRPPPGRHSLPVQLQVQSDSVKPLRAETSSSDESDTESTT